MDVVWILGPTYQRKKCQQATWAKFARIRGRVLQVAFWRQKLKRVDWQAWWRLDCRNRVGEMDVGDPHRQLLKLQQLVTQRSAVGQRWQKQLYRQGRTLVGMPWACHRLKAMPGGAKSAQWELTLVVLLALEQGGRSINELRERLMKQDWFSFGATKQLDAVSLWLAALCDEWVKQQVIHRDGDYIRLRQKLTWYSDYQQKLKKSHNSAVSACNLADQSVE
jgi:competence protein CoiA